MVATRTKVALEDSTTLHCIVNRTNPEVDTYVWMHEDPDIQLAGSDSTLSVIFATENHFGTITCTATNAADRSGSATVTIERGCKFCM